MKRMMLLSVVAALATLALGTGASAQTLAPKPLFATVACRGNTAACVNLDLYQKMAATSGTASAATSGASKGATAGANNPVAARRTRAAGGVENNPAADSGASVHQTMRKNADRQMKLMAKNVGRQKVAPSSASKPANASQGERLKNRALRRADDPTNNNPFSEGRAASQPRTQTHERATAPRERMNRANDRTLYMIRAREVTRHRPTDF